MQLSFLEYHFIWNIVEYYIWKYFSLIAIDDKKKINKTNPSNTHIYILKVELHIITYPHIPVSHNPQVVIGGEHARADWVFETIFFFLS